MNKPEANNGLIPVRDYAAQRLSRRGYPVSVKYIYKLISDYKTGKRAAIDFQYKEIDKAIWIVE